MSTIYRSPLPDVEIPDISITDHVFRHAQRLGDRVAIVDGPSGRSFTYQGLADAIGSASGGLAEAGFGEGDVLAIVAPNIPDYAIAFHAIASIGAVVTTINPTYTTHEIAHQLRDSAATGIVTVPACLDSVREASQDTRVRMIYTFDGAGTASSFSALLEADPIQRRPGIRPASDVVVLPYSSGTTGLPKGVELTHRNLVANLSQTEPLSTVSDDDVIIAVLPFFHIYGMQILMNGVLFHGATTVTMPRFDLAVFLQTIQEYRVTRAALVPPIVLALAKHPVVEEYDLSSLVQVGSGAAPLSPEIEEMASERTGAEIVQGFGLTETSPVTHSALPGQARSGSIGVLIPNTEARLVDPITGKDAESGVSAELWLRGPQVMKGYLNNSRATDDTFAEDGWLKTGDMATVDDDHWYITDRLKELIKYKGFQVAPAELEAVLLTHPAVADAAVIGVADEEAGEIPMAFVVENPGEALTEENILKYVSGRVASFKQLRRVDFIDQIPKSLSGKILRRVLREKVSAEAPR